MADYSYDDLISMPVAKLREIAEGVESSEVQGYATMHKEDLAVALCKAWGIEARTVKKVVGIDKQEIKGKIQELKKKRTAALEANDHTELKRVRRKIHRLKRKMRKAMATAS
jgi:hypothetical protein